MSSHNRNSNCEINTYIWFDFNARIEQFNIVTSSSIYLHAYLHCWRLYLASNADHMYVPVRCELSLSWCWTQMIIIIKLFLFFFCWIECARKCIKYVIDVAKDLAARFYITAQANEILRMRYFNIATQCTCGSKRVC